MGDRLKEYEEYCRVIDEFSTCVDAYPFVYDVKRDYFYVSKKAIERFSLTTNAFGNAIQWFRNYMNEDDLKLLANDIQKTISGEYPEHNVCYHWIRSDHSLIWVHSKGHLTYDCNGEAQFILGCVNEIGERQTADNITGLRQTGEIREELDAGGYPSGFFMRLGLDGFKNVVEHHGMEFGDSVLRGVAICISGCLMDGQRVFRAISDEFLIADFIEGTKEDATRLYRKIRAALDFYIESNGYQSVFTVSAGCIETNEIESQSYSEVMRLSRYTLNMAKNRGRNQIYLFDEKDYRDFLHKNDLTIALRQAVASDFDGFELYFQPIVFSDSADERLYAAESLCRFFMKGKVVSPAEFIPILEETGLIIPVGRWIMEQAVLHCKRCRQYNSDFRITVNLSYVQILKSGLTEDLKRILQKYELPAEALVVEMTESGFLESTASVEHVWNHLRDLGVRIAIDDFGSGYSNMRYLDRLRPNVIKIDRNFTIEALSREYAHHLLVNIIRMAHSMDLTVCIEGVETGEELVSIQEINPDYIQGFYYGKPCTAESFLDKFMR